MSNTTAAKEARKDTQEDKDADKDDEERADTNSDAKSTKKKIKEDKPSKSGTKHKRSSKEKKDGANDSEDEEEEVNDEQHEARSQPAVKKAKGNDGKKRVTRSQTKGDLESQENSDEDADPGSTEKGDKEHGQPGDTSRLPKKGQEVYWRSTPGWCEGTIISAHLTKLYSNNFVGTVVDVLHSETEVDGIHAKASEDDPRIVLESSKSGKKAVHKPEAVYF